MKNNKFEKKSKNGGGGWCESAIFEQKVNMINLCNKTIGPFMFTCNTVHAILLVSKQHAVYTFIVQNNFFFYNLKWHKQNSSTQHDIVEPPLVYTCFRRDTPRWRLYVQSTRSSRGCHWSLFLLGPGSLEIVSITEMWDVLIACLKDIFH